MKSRVVQTLGRCRWQFSLRSFLWATTLCGLGLGYVAQGQVYQVETWLIIDRQSLAQGNDAIGPCRVVTQRTSGPQPIRTLSERVLARALERPDVARLPLVHRKVEPLAWLRDHLQVEPWGTSDLVRIRLAGHDREQVARLLSAIAESYFAGSGGVSHEQHAAAAIDP